MARGPNGSKPAVTAAQYSHPLHLKQQTLLARHLALTSWQSHPLECWRGARRGPKSQAASALAAAHVRPAKGQTRLAPFRLGALRRSLVKGPRDPGANNAGCEPPLPSLSTPPTLESAARRLLLIRAQDCRSVGCRCRHVSDLPPFRAGQWSANEMLKLNVNKRGRFSS